MRSLPIVAIVASACRANDDECLPTGDGDSADEDLTDQGLTDDATLSLSGR